MGPSTIAGRYSLDAEVGRGGMGAVWRGTDRVLGRPVALKRVGVAPGGATPDVVRAAREARLAASLNDPHVVSVFDLVGEGDEQWLVMEYVEGTDLAELIRQRGALTAEEVAPLLAQAAGALAAAHAIGIVHRDVKPSNILVTPGGEVKLSDFGIARTQADAALTQTGLVTGSPAYLSPEVASGRLATAPSDMWSLGATLFHALEGHPPYDLGENLIGGLYRIVHEEPPRSTHAGRLAPMLLGTMTHDPAERWTAAQAQAFLASGVVPALLPSTLTTALAAPPPTALAPTPANQHRGSRGRAWWIVAAAVLVVLALAGWAVALDLGDDPGSSAGDQRSGASASTAPSTTPSSGSESDGGSEVSGDASAAPSADEMTAFLSQYLQTVVSDRDAAFAELTPGYQARSGGLGGYSRFWDDVSRPRLISAQSDPATLTVSYTYSYVRDGKRSKVESHQMRLEYAAGRYLIADQT